MIHLITRHPGGAQWLKEAVNSHRFGLLDEQPIQHRHIEHLYEDDNLQAGDIVIGTLPVDKVALLNSQGIRYYHLCIDIPPELRGVELGYEQLNQLNARLREFTVSEIAPCSN